MNITKLIPLLMMLTLSLVACSNEDSADWISSDGTNIYIEGEKTYMSSFDGTRGIYELDGDPLKLSYSSFEGNIRDSPDNRQGVHEADLSKYKDSKYFDAFMDTFSAMYITVEKDKYKVATISTEDKAMKPLELVREEVYKTLEKLKFKSINAATFSDSIIINGNGNSIVVRNTDITIPGILSVFKGTREVTQQVDINGITVMKYETDNFDFYQYGDNLIKVAKGVNISEYITLK